MASVRCPVTGCTYATPEGVEDHTRTVLMTIHANASHTQEAVKPVRMKRPEITSSGTTERWNYFTTRWTAYHKATRLQGADLVLQLLECCDDKLRESIQQQDRRHTPAGHDGD